MSVDERHIAAENVSFFHLSCFILSSSFFVMHWLCSRQLFPWLEGSSSFLGNTSSSAVWYNEHDLAHTCWARLSCCNLSNWLITPQTKAVLTLLNSQCCVGLLFCFCVTSPPAAPVVCHHQVVSEFLQDAACKFAFFKVKAEDAPVWHEWEILHFKYHPRLCKLSMRKSLVVQQYVSNLVSIQFWFDASVSRSIW